MIPRYSRPEMASLWTDEEKFGIWLEVELQALKAMENHGLATKGFSDQIRAKAKVNVERALELEKEVKHDVIAFLTSISEQAGEPARSLHRGMTSSDLLDTSLAVQLVRSGKLIQSSLKKLMDTAQRRALEYKMTPCIGRSHGIHAEPTTFGIKVLSWFAELRRMSKRIDHSIESISVGKIAGAVGTYASLNPQLEEEVLKDLGLRCEEVPSQIVHRDRHADFFLALAQLGASIERICVEIRHLQRTEVGEAQEGFTKGQKGSSAMPHKKNPIGTENLTGVARLLRGYAFSALENVALWHERDISHSSVERVVGPDACILTHYMLERMNSILENLVVNEAKMKENLALTKGLYFSGTLLLKLTDKGVSREDAYKAVQDVAMRSWEEQLEFKTEVEKDKFFTSHLSEEEFKEVFDLSHHLRFVDTIFGRVLNS